MSVPCVTQARIFSARRSKNNEEQELAIVCSSWSLPVWILPMESSSAVSFGGIDDSDPAVLLHSRIATPLGIEDGDTIVFELTECGERFLREVTVSSELLADFVIYNALSLEICTKAGVAKKTSARGIVTTTTTLQLRNHPVPLKLPGQDLWTETTTKTLKGFGILHFDGASRPNGPAGFGYSISSASSSSSSSSSTTEEQESNNVVVGPDLIHGYCYCGSGTVLEMQYAALLEACIWAVRFRFEKLWIRGDAALVISQVSGETEVSEQDADLVEYFYYTKIQALLEQASEEGTEIDLEAVSKEANVIANVLASLALDVKENVTACNWDNINEQCRRPKK